MNNFTCGKYLSQKSFELLKEYFKPTHLNCNRSFHSSLKTLSTKVQEWDKNIITICNRDYLRDDNTNVTPRILNYVDRKLHLTRNHPLNLVKKKLVDFMYGRYVNRRGNPLFSIYDKLDPVVTVEQNFDSLLIQSDHPSRNKTDTYYVNSNYLLRTHTSAHQKELILSGLDNFLVIGDVYRRDEIDSKHFPVFHQVESVRLFSQQELFHTVLKADDFKLFENDVRKPEKQECHCLETVKLMEHDLKTCLLGLIQRLFGSNIQTKWTASFFPFTHPSWELEVFWKGQWLEVLGCGIIEQEILRNAGAGDKVGWAFGLGLERLAMMLYDINDIRQFWSQDSGFLSQFNVKDTDAPIKFKPVSKYPQCINDMSFWVPETFHPNDFYDIVRSVGGEMVEQVNKIDEFFHPKKNKQSFCFRIIYRHTDRTLTKTEVNEIHKEIGKAVTENLGVEIRQ